MISLLSLAEAARGVASRELSPLDLVESCQKRIEQLESRVKAWVLVDADGARREARKCADEMARGDRRGPLHGIPIAIKDIIDVAGWPTLAGTRLRAGHVATRDAHITARLRAAGAIFLGKTVTTEFASFDPPPTRNPWNLSRTPGGSSSGSAAASATGMCYGAIGSQTGGSITRPASYCGVAGCKPTYGLVDLDGIVPLAFHMDHPGPIARRVADLAILLEVLAEPLALSGGAITTAPAYSRLLEPGHVPRLGVLHGYFVERAEVAVRKEFDAVVDKLRSAGAVITPISPPADFDEVFKMHRRIMAVEAAEVQRETFPRQSDAYGRELAALLREGRSTELVDYVTALRHQETFRRSVGGLFNDVEAIILPATTSTAPDAATTGDPAFNSPWSYSALPVVSFPTGVAADGLPLGVQMVGPRLGEAGLLAAANWCERVIDFHERPPILDES